MLTSIDLILDRALTGHNLTVDEGVTLMRERSASALAKIQAAADQLRQQLVGDTVTYVVNRNINFTNICEQHCSFCAFRRDDGDTGAFWLAIEQILAKARDAEQRGATVN